MQGKEKTFDSTNKMGANQVKTMGTWRKSPSTDRYDIQRNALGNAPCKGELSGNTY